MKVILLMAVTADGKIARNSMELIDWSGKEDKKYFVRVTKQAGVMIMGSRTFDTIGRALPGRRSIVMTRDKKRISSEPDLVFTGSPPKEILADLKDQGFASAALIGGAIINTLFMAQRLIDEIHITVVPKVFGRGLSLFDASLDENLELLEVRQLEKGCIILKYKVNKTDQSLQF